MCIKKTCLKCKGEGAFLGFHSNQSDVIDKQIVIRGNRSEKREVRTATVDIK